MQKILLYIEFTFLSAGLIIMAILVYRHKVFTENHSVSPAAGKVVQGLPTSFRAPAPDNPPHIVGAKIDHISIPEKHVSADIIQSMPGLPEYNIIQINNIMTGMVFDNTGTKDIRIPKNRTIDPGVKIYNIKNKILYVDKGIIGTYSEEAVSRDGAPVSTPANPGKYVFIDTNITENSDLVDIFDTSTYSNKDKILEHFYPNGKELFEKYIKEKDSSDPELACYTGKSFPKDFFPTLRLNTGEVVFSVIFTATNSDHCTPGVELFTTNDIGLRIAIPISDILTQVPELVPKGSVLWYFK